MINQVIYTKYRKDEGQVKLIRLPHFYVEFHWDDPGEEIIRSIREQLEGASLYQKTSDCWVLVKGDRECHLYFSDAPGYELLKFVIVIKQSYEYTREEWQRIWNEWGEGLDQGPLGFNIELLDPDKIKEVDVSSTHPYAPHALEQNIRIREKEAAKAEIISVEVCHSNHGDFLKSVAHVFHKADRENKEIIRDAWYKLIKKYRLEEEYKQAIEEHLPEYLEGYK